MKNYDFTKKPVTVIISIHLSPFLWKKTGLYIELWSEGNVYINLSLSKYLGTCVFFVKGSIPAHLTYLWSLSARPVPGCLRFQCGPGLRQAHLSRAERHSVSPMPRSWKGGSQRLWNQILNQIASFHWYLPLPERFCFSICFSWGHQPPLPVLGLWGDRAWGFSFTPT